MVRETIRALRLPFLSASILPFIFGSLITRYNFNLWGFVLGLVSVLTMHLSANLINDYADSKSGVDWQDKNYYKFFGGSKLIQEGVFKESFYLKLAILFLAISSISVVMLFLILKRLEVIILYLVIVILGWSYSHKPLEFSYHRLGELVIFLLFGPALVMGGYFIQTGIFPDVKSFMLSLPFGFMTMTVLFVNEIPDFIDDKKLGKFTWVSICGPERAFLIYYLLMGLFFLSILLNFMRGYLSIWSLLSFIFVIPAHRASTIIRKFPYDKIHLIDSSKWTLMIHFLSSLFLITILFI